MHSCYIPGLATSQARGQGAVHELLALRDDLSRRFGQDFRVIGETFVTAGLETLRDLAGQQDRVALLITTTSPSHGPGITR